MNTDKSDRERVLALLQPHRYPVLNTVVPTAAQAHALIETLIYLVENTPPLNEHRTCPACGQRLARVVRTEIET